MKKKTLKKIILLQILVTKLPAPWNIWIISMLSLAFLFLPLYVQKPFCCTSTSLASFISSWFPSCFLDMQIMCLYSPLCCKSLLPHFVCFLFVFALTQGVHVYVCRPHATLALLFWYCYGLLFYSEELFSWSYPDFLLPKAISNGTLKIDPEQKNFGSSEVVIILEFYFFISSLWLITSTASSSCLL